MLKKIMRRMVMAAAIAGLCACANTNTTWQGRAPVRTVPKPLITVPAQNNVAAMPQPPAEPASEAVTESIATPMVTPAPQAFVGRPSEPPVAVAVLKAEAQAQVEAQAQGEAQPPPANIAKTDDGKVVNSTTNVVNGNGGSRVALLLPLRSDALKRAAEVVQAGFMASYERGVPGEMSVEVIETGDTAQQVLAAYNAAVADYDIIVGPLSRSGVTAIAQGGKVVRPTIALAQADAVGDVEQELPANMVSIGLSVEAEARQVALLADADGHGPRALVVSTNIAWQRRAARAFASQWMRKGSDHAIENAELGLSSGYLNANNVAALLKKIQAERPALVFLALDAAQAAQLRESIGTDLPTYGTSQLNPLALPDWAGSEGRPLLSGIKLVDMPWQLSADHPAVMIYPRMTVAADQRRSADMERLYALGIDAQRVAHEIVQKRFDFQVDGVTGTLDIDLADRPARFERTESSAIYQDGKVVPAIAP